MGAGRRAHARKKRARAAQPRQRALSCTHPPPPESGRAAERAGKGLSRFTIASTWHVCTTLIAGGATRWCTCSPRAGSRCRRAAWSSACARRSCPAGPPWHPADPARAAAAGSTRPRRPLRQWPPPGAMPIPNAMFRWAVFPEHQPSRTRSMHTTDLTRPRVPDTTFAFDLSSRLEVPPALAGSLHSSLSPGSPPSRIAREPGSPPSRDLIASACASPRRPPPPRLPLRVPPPAVRQHVSHLHLARLALDAHDLAAWQLHKQAQWPQLTR